MSRLFGLICGIIRFDSCHELIKRHYGAFFILRFIDKRVVVIVLCFFHEDSIINGDESGDRLAVLGDNHRFVGVRDAGDGVSKAVAQMQQRDGVEVAQSVLGIRSRLFSCESWFSELSCNSSKNVHYLKKICYNRPVAKGERCESFANQSYNASLRDETTLIDTKSHESVLG